MGETKCKDCQKGKYMQSCNATFVKCEKCPPNTYTATDNQMNNCLACSECSSMSNLMTDVECAADRNRQCKCKPGYYCNHSNKEHCDHCVPVSMCPPGQGVSKNYTDLKDTKCSLCPSGTYSNVTDYISSCKNHTSCESLGRDLKVAGTPTTDAECGDFKCRSCNWMLPAGLWAGLVVTALIIFLVLFIIYWRTKRQSKTSVISLDYLSSTSPTPPDILKCPACVVEKHEEDQKLTNIVDGYSLDGTTKCEFGMMQVMRMSEKYTGANDYTDPRTMCHSFYQSEPQESEWHD